jgi:hypothetical protein
LGRPMGAMVLPTLGLHFIQEAVRKVAGFVSLRLTKIIDSIADSSSSHVLQEQLLGDEDPLGGIPFSLSALSSVAELNYEQQKRSKPSKDPNSKVPSPLDLLCMGEVGYAFSFTDSMPADASDFNKVENAPSIAMVPNPFIFADHWACTIRRMEDRMAESDAEYDPNSYLLPPPKPVDERWFPDLCLGWGDALCTHSQREILHNRLMATLLNRLAANYALEMTKIGDAKRAPFVVQMNRSSPALFQPSDFVEALLASGYSVETLIQTQTTTFGVALCVREVDKTWTNIPLAFFLQDGFSDSAGNESFVGLPHSGLNLEIRGTSESLIPKVSIQHYMAIEGLCGWHSNHSANVPWLSRIDCAESVRRGSDVLESVCVAGLQAVVVNAVSTCYDLPFGGYGLTGVCNDSAALLELALSTDRKTHVFPLTFIGKFAMQMLRMAYELRNVLKKNHGNHPPYSDQVDIASLDRLIEAIMLLPSDTNMAPVDALEQCRRWLYCQTPVPPFRLMKQSRSIVESIQSDILQIRSSLYT